MEFNVLDNVFQPQTIIDEFTSAIWTERYTKAGDCKLVLPATPGAVSTLKEGTFLQRAGGDEVCILETALIEKGLLTCSGPTLDKFLNNRVFRATAAHEDRYWNRTERPGNTMATLVSANLIAGGGFTNSAYGIDGARQVIPNLTIDSYDNTGAVVAIAVPYGPMYDILEQIAETYSIGFRLYLASVTPTGYSLKFKVWRGLDRRRSQSVNEIVSFSPALDTLTELTELRSVAGYKNVAYAFAPGNPEGLASTPGVAYADGAAEASTGFNRRAMMVYAEDITTDLVGGNAQTLLDILNQRARDALANNNYTKILDGEVVPQSQFQYGTHYGMGDVVELAGTSGFAQTARITEYIRTQDADGERAYPTVSVLV